MKIQLNLAFHCLPFQPPQFKVFKLIQFLALFIFSDIFQKKIIVFLKLSTVELPSQQPVMPFLFSDVTADVIAGGLSALNLILN